MTSNIGAVLKQALKRKRKSVKLALLRGRHAFSAQDLKDGLTRLGLTPGDTVLVHSSYDQFAAFTGKPTEVNAVLQEIVGVEGHVMMPTMPFTGTAVEYASRQTTFDVRRTPSQMGLLTELFRRQAGTIRSVHPTHPVAVSGPKALRIAEAHHLAETPCGRGTPYARLLEMNGKILFMGTDISVMTFFHYVEEELESHMPFSPFTTEKYTLRSLDKTGIELETVTRLFNPAYSRTRNLHKLVPNLKRQRMWNDAKIGGVPMILLSATSIMSTCQDMASRGIFCYDV